MTACWHAKKSVTFPQFKSLLANNRCVKFHIRIPSSCVENVKKISDSSSRRSAFQRTLVAGKLRRAMTSDGWDAWREETGGPNQLIQTETGPVGRWFVAERMTPRIADGRRLQILQAVHPPVLYLLAEIEAINYLVVIINEVRLVRLLV